jgi:hypothetical protein
VAPDLGKLAGPTAGVVTLPHRLVWAPAPANVFDLDDDFDRRHLYEIVLQEAVQQVELETWLDGSTLVALWPRLYLPRGLRQVWEQAHSSLHRTDPESPA